MKISFVVPVYNEESGIKKFHKSLTESIKLLGISHEVIYINDGSSDSSLAELHEISKSDQDVKILSFSRNFGKEAALSAGYDAAKGDAAISMDSDGQHPPEYIGGFIDEWKKGSRVVIGIRNNKTSGLLKSGTSRLYYSLYNKLSKEKVTPGSTDFRLVDRLVLEELSKLKENNRITRGLIDWLGYKRSFIWFNSKERIAGKATYSFGKLFTLAKDSIVSMSSTPLYIFGILGLFITVVSFILGFVVLVEQILLGDPLNWNFTGTAQLSILILFLVGLILVSQGVVSLYISQINIESKNRPNYVIDKENSKGI